MYQKKVHLHFIGIGGIGMSGIAKILSNQGYTISGCDKDLEQQSIKDLQQLCCTIFQGNNTPACIDSSIDIVVYSSAIKSDNAEIIAAQKRGIPTIPRALMLAELMRTKYSIAIAGTHGKTTTTSLISHILLEAKKEPTVIIGGHLKNISANAYFGNGDFLVAEADESDKSLIHLQATLAVLTNIDYDHVDVYRDLEEVKATFKQFLNNLPFYGKAIVCSDDDNIRSLFPLPHIKTIKYGLDKNRADFYATDVQLNADHSHCMVWHHHQKLGPVHIHMPGEHNVLNSLAAIALAHELDIPFNIIATALQNFKGIERRFSFKGMFQKAEIFDDYGHHPEEIRRTLQVARKRAKNKLTVVFQPHRYTRTDKLWNQFVDIFFHSPIDHLIITDIYPASEEPVPEITAQNLVKAIKRQGPHFQITYIPYEHNFTSIKNSLVSITQPKDLILLQGAGKLFKFLDFV